MIFIICFIYCRIYQ